MQLSNIPGKLVLPWATSGNKNNIPVTSQIGITPGAASLTDGFPPLTMTPVAAGGVPPSGLDMNGILYEMSTILRWANAGGGYAYDSTFANDSRVGGYPKGARVMRSDGFGYWLNTVDNNVTDPESAGAAAAGWVPDFSNGAAAVTMTSANITLTPLQYGKPLIVITGTLTGNLNLIFPAIVGRWVVINGTTGNYSITAKTSGGIGVIVPQSRVHVIFGDGTNVISEDAGSFPVDYSVDYPDNTVGFCLVKIANQPVNILKGFSKSEIEAIQSKSSETDHTEIVSDIITNERSVFVPFGRFNLSAGIVISENPLDLSGAKGSEFKFTDGAYTGLSFSGASAGRSRVSGIYFYGTEHSAPLITLLQNTLAPYFDLIGCKFAYASKLVGIDGSYIVKLSQNDYNNADVFLDLAAVAGSTADIVAVDETFGTTNIGSSSIVKVGATGVRMHCYWETQNHTKVALEALTGAGCVQVGGRFEASGGVIARTSTALILEHIFGNNSYSSSSNRFLRCDGGATLQVNGGQLLLSDSVSATAISSAGATSVLGTTISGVGAALWTNGVHAGGGGVIRPALVSRCSTGISLASGCTSTVANDIAFEMNTTNMSNNSGGTAVAPGPFAVSLTGCTTIPTGTARYEVNNGLVTISLPHLSGTSNSNAATITGLPAAIQPKGIEVFGTPVVTIDDGVAQFATASINGGTITLYKDANSTVFTNTGTKGIRASTITYRIRNVS